MWGHWTACSPTCDSGIQSRSRSCSNPVPTNGGAECAGISTGTIACFSTGCLVNGGWAAWSSWTSCTRTCDGGEKTRERNCTNPAPVGLGQACIGNSDETAICNREPCSDFTYDCQDILQKGVGTEDGVYSVELNQTGEIIQVYCDMTSDGGDWTVFQKRHKGSVDFYKNFHDYENGFGSVSGEFWLGLKYIYEMTKDETTELRLDLEKSGGQRGYAVYQSFSLSGPSKYNLKIGTYNGTVAEDSRWGLSYNHGYAFTTYDSDNDKDSVLNCAVHHHGAWWYRACTFANLNGEYMVPGKSYRQSAFYYAFDHYHSLKSIEMKFRRIH